MVLQTYLGANRQLISLKVIKAIKKASYLVKMKTKTLLSLVLKKKNKRKQSTEMIFYPASDGQIFALKMIAT